MRRYVFISAGGGEFYTKRLQQLSVGDEVFVNDKDNGYIGYGIVTSEAQPASEFMTSEGPLFEQPLAEPRFKRVDEPAEHAEHVVGVEWRKTVETNQAKWFKGGFANQNIVCKLREEATVDFLITEFEIASMGGS